jgi:hypothetical protein
MSPLQLVLVTYGALSMCDSKQSEPCSYNIHRTHTTSTERKSSTNCSEWGLSNAAASAGDGHGIPAAAFKSDQQQVQLQAVWKAMMR